MRAAAHMNCSSAAVKEGHQLAVRAICLHLFFLEIHNISGLPSLICHSAANEDRRRVDFLRVKKTVGLSLFVKYFCGPWMPAAARAASIPDGSLSRA